MGHVQYDPLPISNPLKIVWRGWAVLNEVGWIRCMAFLSSSGFSSFYLQGRTPLVLCWAFSSRIPVGVLCLRGDGNSVCVCVHFQFYSACVRAFKRCWNGTSSGAGTAPESGLWCPDWVPSLDAKLAHCCHCVMGVVRGDSFLYGCRDFSFSLHWSWIYWPVTTALW